MHPHALCAALVGSALIAQASQFTVVPAAAAAADMPYRCWLAGAARNLRQQVLVGPGHLAGVVGRTISAIEYRRSAADEIFVGSTITMRVTLSTAPHSPLDASDEYAANVGADATVVYQGPVSLPTSPPAVGPAVPWTADNVVRIPLQQPFPYSGGTLCVDITGTLPAGAAGTWWLADSMYEDIHGDALQLGPGCGPHANAAGQWSFASVRSLLAGGVAQLWAYGPPGGFAVAVLGDAAAQPIPLAALGFPSPGCNAWLGSVTQLDFRQFVGLPDPGVALPGVAELQVPIPAAPWVLGLQAAVQWLELTNHCSSNALLLTVAATMPSLDAAMVDGEPSEARGLLTLHTAHVLRFEHQ